MSVRAYTGQPAVAAVSLTNAAPGPVAVPIYITQGSSGNAYTLRPTERFVMTAYTISSNDTAQPKVTIDDGAATPKVLASVYASPSTPAMPSALPIGIALGKVGTNPRATASAVTSAKTVEVVLYGAVQPI